jgi:hypothetical protein
MKKSRDGQEQEEPLGIGKVNWKKHVIRPEPQPWNYYRGQEYIG